MEKETKISSIGDIDAKLSFVGGDMLKIEFLEGAIKRDLPTEVRKYAHIKLAELYDKRLMAGIAARNMESAAESAVSFKEKKDLYLKQVFLLIKNHSFDEAEKALKKAHQSANTRGEKEELNAKFKTMLMEKALDYEKLQNVKKASEVYEKLMYLDPSNLDIKKKLAVLYNRLGKIKEAIALEHALKNPLPPVPAKQPEFSIDKFLKGED